MPWPPQAHGPGQHRFPGADTVLCSHPQAADIRWFTHIVMLSRRHLGAQGLLIERLAGAKHGALGEVSHSREQLL